MTQERYVPLTSGFMAIAIIGFFISIWLPIDTLQLSPDTELSWRFTFALFFVLMFIASMITMTRAEVTRTHMRELEMHEEVHKKREIGKLHKIVHEINKKPLKLIWQDIIIFLFLIAYIYFGIAQITPIMHIHVFVNMAFYGITLFLVLTIILDTITSEKLTAIQKTIISLCLIFLGGLGVVIFYVYRRIKHRWGQKN
ncbi:hypothetical protein K9L97_02450 [Candidatus Woesearchaeota archaeon]|nr:hypothetical protein [Candidatus Woesearchaeota archaeon]